MNKKETFWFGILGVLFLIVPSVLGGFHFEKLGFFKKAILKMLKKSLLKKENKTPTDEFMAKYLCTSFDHSSKDKILPLVEFCK